MMMNRSSSFHRYFIFLMFGSIILFTLIGPTITQAATYYVATTGNNSNSGTSSQPWRTVAYAVDRMVAGDTTYVKGGVYNEGTVRFKRSGTQSAPIKLLNAPGAFPIIDCIDKNKGQMVLLQNSSGSRYPMGWITIEGFEIRDCYNGLKFYNAHNLSIRRNWIHHNSPGQGILGNGTKILIDRNKINHNGSFGTCSGSGCTQDHGIYGNGTAFTITNNLIYDNLAHGIQLNGTVRYDSTQHAGTEFAVSRDWLIANNTFAYQKYESALVIWGSTCTNARVENNIFYENAAAASSIHANGIKFVGSTPCTGIRINSNLAFASGSGGIRFITSNYSREGVHYTMSGNVVNTVNPKFTNAPVTLPSSPNFTLVSGSPAIDKGLSISSAKTSYPGTTRPQLSAYDVGAYEYYGSSTSLATPTSLQVAN
jgi:hypothetical protein